jgi:hypothetical protein
LLPARERCLDDVPLHHDVQSVSRGAGSVATRGDLKILILSNDGHGRVEYTVGYLHCDIVQEENESSPISN